MTQTDQDVPPLWRFVALHDYDRPPEPAGEKVRRGLWSLWDRLVRPRGPAAQGEAERPGEPDDRYEEAVLREPDWQEAVPALDEALQDWLTSGGGNGALQAVLSAPLSGVGHIVSLWAAARNWRVIEPPGARQLLTGEGERLRELELHDETPWVVPALEEWYLRHGNGLDPMRQFLDLLASRRRLTLVGCDTWAWAYLSKTVQADLIFPAPLIPAAFNQERLSRWLPTLTRASGDCAANFRQGNNGKYILPPSTPDTEGPQPEAADFLGRLAAYSRGIPGVALAGWRHALRTGVIEGRETPGPTRVAVMWMKPWQKLELPGVPLGRGNRLAFILHTLLLHNGVATRLLPELLPNLSHQLSRDLHELRDAGLTTQEQEVWRVTPLGYPAIRDFLAREGYLVDAV
jgi:hypothetical protein